MPDDAGAFPAAAALSSVAERPAQAPEEAEHLATLAASGLFDPLFYMSRNPGLAATPEEALRHYHFHGWREGRAPNLYFDPKFYLDQNPDVRAAGLDPLLHYIWAGEREGRRPVLYFDPAWYRSRFSLAPGESALAHFLRERHRGAVSPIPEFDAAWYLQTYPDVAEAGMDPFEHYLIQGFREGRDPSPDFDTRFYRQRYLQGRRETNPLLHYLRHRGEPGIHPRRPLGEVTLAATVRRHTRPGPLFEDPLPAPLGLPPRARVLAFYLPQFYPCPENDAWWGTGFTEWTSLGRALPRFAGHYQPRIPRDLGHYSLAHPETMARQIALARRAGLGGFIFYFYWFGGRRLLERPLETFLARPELDFPFALMWANESWTRRWDGREQDILIAQTYPPEQEAALAATLARHFADPRYIRIEGRPLLFVYRASSLPDPPALLARLRRLFETKHGVRPLFVMAQSFEDLDPRPLGFDAAVEFPPHKLARGLEPINGRLEIFDEEFSAEVYRYEDVALRSLLEPRPSYPLIKTAVPGWDNDPRREGQGLVLHGATPARYQAWLSRLIEESARHPVFGERLVCINAWNEWAEGAYLEPDAHFGGAFLNATARAIAGLAASGEKTSLLLVGHDALVHGAQLLLLHLARHFRRVMGIEVTIILRAGGPLETEYGEVAHVLVLKHPEEWPAAIESLRLGRNIGAAIVNTAANADIVPHLARAGLRVIQLIHEMPALITARGWGEALAPAFAACDRVIFAAETVAEATGTLAPLDPARRRILPQGLYQKVGFDPARRAAARAGRRLAEGERLVIGIGYGDLRKGFDLFVQAARLARRRGLGFRFAWVGALDPALASQLGRDLREAEAAGLELAGRREDIADWLLAADALLLTSREDPYPSVMLEAAACGLPVIAFEGSGGAADFIPQCDAGMLVPFADVEAMVETLIALLIPPPPPELRPARAARLAARLDFGAYARALAVEATGGFADVSVVVPNRDYARYLPERLGSIFAQTHPVREVILLDDASRDESLRVAEETAAAWRRELRVLANDRPSGSVFAQWRRAVAEAKGEYLWIAEADDAAEPQFLARLTAALARAPAPVLAFCDSRVIDGEGREMMPSYRPYYARIAGPGALAADDVFEARGFARRFLATHNLILNASAVLWHRESLAAALERVGDELCRLKLAGDWRLYAEVLLAAAGRSVVYVAAPLNRHRRHPASVTATLPPRRHEAEVSALHRFIAGKLGAPGLAARQRAARAEIRRHLAAMSSSPAALTKP